MVTVLVVVAEELETAELLIDVSENVLLVTLVVDVVVVKVIVVDDKLLILVIVSEV
jgi:hypothetical protein